MFNRYPVLTSEDEHEDAWRDAHTVPKGTSMDDMISKATQNRFAKKRSDQTRERDRGNAGKGGKRVKRAMCLTSDCKIGGHDEELNMCSTTHSEEHDMVSVMIDSGASEAMVSSDRFADYMLAQTSAPDTAYTSAAAGTPDEIIHAGEKYTFVVGSSGAEPMAMSQMCKGPGRDQALATVSRLVQSGHSVVARAPEYGSYIAYNINGYRRYLRLQSGPRYLDFWAKRLNKDTDAGQHAQSFHGQGM